MIPLLYRGHPLNSHKFKNLYSQTFLLCLRIRITLRTKMLVNIGRDPYRPFTVEVFFLISENSGNSEVSISSLGVQLHIYYFKELIYFGGHLFIWKIPQKVTEEI